MTDIEYQDSYGDSHALIIGIDSYSSPNIVDLSEAENDANRLGETLSEPPYNFEVELLIGREATKRNIQDAIFGLRETEPDDRVIIYFAGHGYTQEDRFGRELGYLVCYDTEPERDYTALELSEVTNFRSYAGAKHILFIFDSCFSGKVLGLTRGSQESKEKLLRRRAYQALSGGAGDQTVADYRSMSHYLNELLVEWKDETDEVLTLNMVGLDLQQILTREQGRQQIPQFGHLGGSQGGDFIFNFDNQSEQDFHKWNLAQWERVIKDIFPAAIPQYCHWEEIEEIIRILNIIGPSDNINHMLFPGGGGLDLMGAEASSEENCIELELNGLAYIVKPSRLLFYSFGGQHEWAYFRLETNTLEPSGLYEPQDLLKPHENVVEIEPNQYLPVTVLTRNNYGYDEEGNEIPLPDSARVITRCFSGAFLVVAKRSPYNLLIETYDGRHSNMAAAEFYEYIKSLM